ncbi:unnamed protein product [Blepharisma stoltei]|uniref:POLO box domain-containing protein n=1 Tax=Blepharisma stoltei TaxID=1481888 RepID=A0AAU9J535_9CILI|nr:unnamed protein product [Blepharisma stoltei]
MVAPKSVKMRSKTKRSSSLPSTISLCKRTPKLGARGNLARKAACYSSYIPPDNGEGPQVWIKSWVDYSSKYGLGYLFSNSCVGVFFNDSTKIIADPAGSFFQYIPRAGRSRDEEITTYTFETFPDELKKKVTLLQHFRKRLSKDEPSAKLDMTQQFTKLDMTQPLIYVQKWRTTPYAILFKLSNNLVQVNFQDKTELILCSNSMLVIYMNKLGERSVYPLNTAMDSENKEMTKRLIYTKKVLRSMLQPRRRLELENALLNYWTRDNIIENLVNNYGTPRIGKNGDWISEISFIISDRQWKLQNSNNGSDCCNCSWRVKRQLLWRDSGAGSLLFFLYSAW